MEEKNKIKELEDKIKTCEKEKEELLNSWKREKANFLNYKKEEGERTGKLIEYFLEDLVKIFLPILDNINIAEKETPEEMKDDKWIEGFLKIKNQILDTFKNFELKEIESVGEKFNPELHEAVEMTEGEGESQTVVEEIQKGYTLKNKVLRPSKVKILK